MHPFVIVVSVILVKMQYFVNINFILESLEAEEMKLYRTRIELRRHVSCANVERGKTFIFGIRQFLHDIPSTCHINLPSDYFCYSVAY